MSRYPAFFSLGLILALSCGGDPGPGEDDSRAEAGATDSVLDSPAGTDDAVTTGDAAWDEVAAGSGDGGVGEDANDAASCTSARWVLVDAVPNARQLGAVPLAHGETVACDELYRGSSLSALTLEGCQQFAATGIKTVIDVRSLAEQAAPPAECVTGQSKLISAPLPIPYDVSPTDYLAILYTAPSMRLIFTTLADAAAYPVYYHCLYGKDRTGVVTAVILSALGASRETIQAEYALTGESGFAYYPRSLNAVLDEIDRIGGVDAYFAHIGVPKEQVQAMRSILVRPPVR